MAHLSRNARAKARKKRTITLQKRLITKLAEDYRRTMIALLGILAQGGGEVRVTMGTIQQVEENLRGLGWKVTPSQTDRNEVIMTLVTVEAPTLSPEASADTV